MLQLGGVVAQRWTSTGREFDPQPGRGCVPRPWASCSHPSASTPADSRRRYIESLCRIPSAVMLQLERVDRTDRRARPADSSIDRDRVSHISRPRVSLSADTG